MNLFIFSIAILGLILTMVGMVSYMAKVKKNQAPRKPIGLTIFMLLGVAVGWYAITIANETIDIVIASVPFGFSAFMTAMMFFFLAQVKTPIGDIKIKVGDRILPFEVDTLTGSKFSTEQIKGKRTLLKFYRGSWCPYCSAELKMFNDMQKDFDKFGVNVIALSGDTVVQAKAHAERDDIGMQLLSDPELNVVKQYGVEHQKAAGFESERIVTMMGISMSMGMPSYRSMPIPTSIIIDENGIVKWIDQSEDYRLRASHDRVLDAIKNSFA